MQEKIYFYYTNDLHSDFQHWPRIAGYLKKQKKRHQAENTSSWIVDIGDHIDRVDPIAEAFMGKANVELMNDAGYDIVTLGNNEGITMAHEELQALYTEADFEVVCANLRSMSGIHPDWLKPTVEIQSVNGVRIGVIGLTVPFNPFYNLLDWHVDYPFRTLDKYITELKESTDIIVLLSHLGINEDREIAHRFPDIDVIIGGHTHHLLRTGEIVNNTIITAAGKHCTFIGEVILTWDHLEKKLIQKEAYATKITHMKEDTETKQQLLSFSEQADEILSEEIIQIKEPLAVDWFKNTAIIQALTDTLKEWTKADISMLNAGILLDQFEAGYITYKDVHRICPHPINPCVVELKGSELYEVIRAAHTKELRELALKGFGFRGKVIGRMIFSGIDIETGVHNNGQEYVKGVNFKGEALVSEDTYSLATADAFTFGHLLPEIVRSTMKRFFLPEFMRDLLVHTLRESFADD